MSVRRAKAAASAPVDGGYKSGTTGVRDRYSGDYPAGRITATLHCAALHCAALHCTALGGTALHCQCTARWGTLYITVFLIGVIAIMPGSVVTPVTLR